MCRQGELREEMVLAFKKVPAMVCEVCGEEYVDKDITSVLLTAAEDYTGSGVQLDVREYVAA